MAGACGPQLIIHFRNRKMRSFVCSALFIASLLVGQQWISKSSQAEGLTMHATAHGLAPQAGYATWMAGAR